MIEMVVLEEVTDMMTEDLVGDSKIEKEGVVVAMGPVLSVTVVVLAGTAGTTESMGQSAVGQIVVGREAARPLLQLDPEMTDLLDMTEQRVENQLIQRPPRRDHVCISSQDPSPQSKQVALALCLPHPFLAVPSL